MASPLVGGLRIAASRVSRALPGHRPQPTGCVLVGLGLLDAGDCPCEAGEFARGGDGDDRASLPAAPRCGAGVAGRSRRSRSPPRAGRPGARARFPTRAGSCSAPRPRTPRRTRAGAQPVPGRTRLIGRADRSRKLGTQHRRLTRTSPPSPEHLPDFPGLGIEHRRHDLGGVHVQTDERSSLRQGRLLLCGCGPPRGPKPRRLDRHPTTSPGGAGPLFHPGPDRSDNPYGPGVLVEGDLV